MVMVAMVIAMECGAQREVEEGSLSSQFVHSEIAKTNKRMLICYERKR